MASIENDFLKISATTKGAELDSIFHKQQQLEYLWSGDPAFWGKKSPVLFPIVGTLRENKYLYEGNEYSLSRHGFARDREFVLEQESPNELTFLLKSDDQSKEVYPFDFEFRVSYSLQRNALHVTYDVRNTGENEMFFSVGGHPAFKVPLVEGTSYEDYFLEFEQEETAKRHLLNADGLLESSEDFLRGSNKINLSKELFSRDAIVLNQIHSGMVSLLSEKTEHGLNFYFDGFPFLGFWAAKDADFLCIEPWCGVSDSINHSRQLMNKEGIICLKPHKTFTAVWSVECF